MSIAAIIFTLNKAQWDSSGSGEQRRDVKSFHLPSPLAIFSLFAACQIKWVNITHQHNPLEWRKGRI